MKLSKVASDRELFQELEFKDPWRDACMVQVFDFLYKDAHTVIPDSWAESMASFHHELLESVAFSDPRMIELYNRLNRA